MIKFLPPSPAKSGQANFGFSIIPPCSKMSAAPKGVRNSYPLPDYLTSEILNPAFANFGECPGAPQIYGAASPGSHRPGKGIVKRSPLGPPLTFLLTGRP